MFQFTNADALKRAPDSKVFVGHCFKPENTSKTGKNWHRARFPATCGIAIGPMLRCGKMKVSSLRATNTSNARQRANILCADVKLLCTIVIDFDVPWEQLPALGDYRKAEFDIEACPNGNSLEFKILYKGRPINNVGTLINARCGKADT